MTTNHYVHEPTYVVGPFHGSRVHRVLRAQKGYGGKAEDGVEDTN